MTTPFEDARRHALVGNRLRDWLRDPNVLNNSREPGTGYTLLGVAVVSGFVDQVEQLLERGANATGRCENGETPLLLATWKTEFERPLIVKKLLEYTPKGSIDDTCDLAENNTPLMCAIGKLDKDCIKLLAAAGARQHIRNDDGFDAVRMAKHTNKKWVLDALDPQTERSDLASVVANMVTFTRHVVSWVDRKFCGFMRKVFNFRGARDEITAEKMKALRPGPVEPRPEEFVKDVDTYVRDNPVLDVFFKDNRQFVQKMASKLVGLANDTSTDLGSPEVLPKTIPVTMHQQVIYCGKPRREAMGQPKALALRIARTITMALPEGEGVALYFINQRKFDSPSLDPEGLGRVFNQVSPRGDTSIGTTLKERILQPWVYTPLAAGSLTRPLLVTIITDGGPEPEPQNMLASVIEECGNRLAQNGYPRGCVKFLIGQVGSSLQAIEFLNALKNNENIADVVHVYAGRLDDKFKSFRNERKLDRWVSVSLPLQT
ncbi:hypothetical protein B0J18DRAFT_364010 [Chaetomium sp. MPI-SDFR-AT-0129]|nr:hypothetical protein B0J18DRAFT_364010 [Chaetomium sp. MPI-SDFR-AT-0129]